MAPTADSTSSTRRSDPRSAAAPDGVPLGRVVGAHGLRGELRIRATDDDRESLESVPRIRLARDGGEAEGFEYEVLHARPGRAGECRVALRGVSDRDAAEALSGRLVLARRADLPVLPDGEFYAWELVGCAVFAADGSPLGTVTGVADNGAQDLLCIEDTGGARHLVPVVEPLLREMAPEAGRIVIDPPPGLLGPVAQTLREREPDTGRD